METPFRELALLCQTLEKTRKRKETARLLGSFLLTVAKEDIQAAVNLILGRADPAKKLDAGGGALRDVLAVLVGGDESDYAAAFSDAPDYGEAVFRLLVSKDHAPAGEPLTISGVARRFSAIAGIRGPDSRSLKQALLLDLLKAAAPLEAKYIVKNVIGEMRHGVEEGMVLLALAEVLSIEIEKLRRALMLTGDVAEVAGISIVQGERGLAGIAPQLWRPLKPMLAETAAGVRDTLSSLKGPFALEYKLDGVRAQIHKQGEECRIYSRNLSDITDSFPEVVEAVITSLPWHEAILDSEVVAVDDSGSPLPFQTLMRRIGRVRQVKKVQQEVRIAFFIFDIIMRNGAVLIDLPYAERRRVLEGTALSLVPRIIPNSHEEGEHFFRSAVEAGYEGVVAKSLAGLYTPGARGTAWQKIKKAVSLDMVIIAADWGYGRRKGWLSNYHLAVRDEESGTFVPVGKTFKGLTDREFKAMTGRLLELRTGGTAWTEEVRPEVVVEVLFSEVLKSPRYRSGYALRFARINRVRDDKRPEEIDTLRTLDRLYQNQVGAPSRAA